MRVVQRTRVKANQHSRIARHRRTYDRKNERMIQTKRPKAGHDGRSPPTRTIRVQQSQAMSVKGDQAQARYAAAPQTGGAGFHCEARGAGA
ncbi:hypothetical protein GA0115256_14636 [Streptomyces sp. DconLS]|nr:hypothetical protein GA0115258_11955 [Streptomyces sp. LamerLS-31b]SCG02720.1 hypothetical protein GA0115256_14636 [Streptomyces sp. DconLS]